MPVAVFFSAKFVLPVFLDDRLSKERNSILRLSTWGKLYLSRAIKVSLCVCVCMSVYIQTGSVYGYAPKSSVVCSGCGCSRGRHVYSYLHVHAEDCLTVENGGF